MQSDENNTGILNIESGLAHCFSTCQAWDQVREKLMRLVPATKLLFRDPCLESVREILLPHDWSKKENNFINNYCRDFHKRSEILGACYEQPTLAPFIELEDSNLLNENVEGEVFDIDKQPEGLIRARIVHYDICNNVFEIATDQLDLWDFGDRIGYWNETGTPMNEHLIRGRAKHVPIPLTLPKIEEIQQGIVLGAGVIGQNIRVKPHKLKKVDGWQGNHIPS